MKFNQELAFAYIAGIAEGLDGEPGTVKVWSDSNGELVVQFGRILLGIQLAELEEMFPAKGET